MGKAILAAGVGLAIGLSGAALMATIMQPPRRQPQSRGQQSGVSSYEVRRDADGRIESVESFAAPSQMPTSTVQ